MQSKSNKVTAKKNKAIIDFNSSLIIFIGLISFIAYNFYFGYNKIGFDFRYLIFVNILPLLLGVLFIFYRSKKLIKSMTKPPYILKFMVFDLFSQILYAFLLSYFTLGFATKATWDYFNLREIKQNKIEFISCKITKVSIGAGKRGPEIDFIFNGRNETISIDYESYSECLKRKYKEKKVDLYIKKGIWNYYVIDNYRIRFNDSEYEKRFFIDSN